MGLFDFFRKNKTAPTTNSRNAAQATSVPRELLVSDHEVDNQIFAILAEHVDMTAPREQNHYSYYTSEEGARAALAEAKAAGWTPVNADEEVYQLEGESLWSMSVTRCDMPTNAQTIPGYRAFFEDLANRHGGEYDGWEAASS